MNALAIKLLHSGFGSNEHNRNMGCESAKQIWDLLEVTHEGTSEVKHSKIDLLMSKYKWFVMEPRESIQEMFTRFTNITNELVSLNLSLLEDTFPLMNMLGKFYVVSLKMNAREPNS